MCWLREEVGAPLGTEVKAVSAGRAVAGETELPGEIGASRVETVVCKVPEGGGEWVEIVLLGEVVDTSGRAVEREVSGGTTVSGETELSVEVVDSCVNSVWEVCLGWVACVETELLGEVVDTPACPVVRALSGGGEVSAEAECLGEVVGSRVNPVFHV